MLKVGKSDKGLQQEILNYLRVHTAANRLARVRTRSGPAISVVFSLLPGRIESEILRLFENAHWDLPVLNSQRGYLRDEDAQYRK